MADIQVYVPLEHLPEMKWILSVIFKDFLGLEYRIQPSELSKYKLCRGNKQIELPDIFLHQARLNWLAPITLPQSPPFFLQLNGAGLATSVLTDPVPIIFGSSKLNISEEKILCDVDIFGTIFFMLSRYEEYVKSDRDNHDRFLAKTSYAFKNRILNRPVVDEHVELLWLLIKLLWPDLKRKTRQFKQSITCDVDQPFEYQNMPAISKIRKLTSHILRAKSAANRKNHLINFYNVHIRGGQHFDRYFNNLFKIMDLSEQINQRCQFYFICDHLAGGIDGFYSLEDPNIRALLQKINQRGHKIGLHPSYNTFQNPTQTKKEFFILRNVCNEIQIEQVEWGTRQHYLRLELPTTLRNLEAAGLDFDSTLSYADQAGFRCGTSYEFQLYDVVDRRPLKLYEKPLILMECSVISSNYMNLGYTDQAIDYMLDLKKACRRFNGTFTFLWHNSHFNSEKDWEFYRTLIMN
jgi:hypothetical protein